MFNAYIIDSLAVQDTFCSHCTGQTGHASYFFVFVISGVDSDGSPDRKQSCNQNQNIGYIHSINLTFLINPVNQFLIFLRLSV